MQDENETLENLHERLEAFRNESTVRAMHKFGDGRKVIIKKSNGCYVWEVHNHGWIHYAGIGYHNEVECFEDAEKIFGIKKWSNPISDVRPTAGEEVG